MLKKKNSSLSQTSDAPIPYFISLSPGRDVSFVTGNRSFKAWSNPSPVFYQSEHRSIPPPLRNYSKRAGKG
jgi:hypothetical protein